MKNDTHKIADWREERRLCAPELKEQGWLQRAIAQALGVTEHAVGRPNESPRPFVAALSARMLL